MARPRPLHVFAVWAGLGLATAIPVAMAMASPLLAWRDPIYILGGFAGILALPLLLVQPLLAANLLPSLHTLTARRVHRWMGRALVLLIVLHVAGLWITSPPDVIDALLLRSPTPFSLWGVIAMIAVFGSALFATLRRRLRLRPALWRLIHLCFATVIIAGTLAHALLIEGAMETVTKALLCLLMALTGAKVVFIQLKRTRLP